VILCIWTFCILQRELRLFTLHRNLWIWLCELQSTVAVKCNFVALNYSPIYNGRGKQFISVYSRSLHTRILLYLPPSLYKWGFAELWTEDGAVEIADSSAVVIRFQVFSVVIVQIVVFWVVTLWCCGLITDVMVLYC